MAAFGIWKMGEAWCIVVVIEKAGRGHSLEQHWLASNCFFSSIKLSREPNGLFVSLRGISNKQRSLLKYAIASARLTVYRQITSACGSETAYTTATKPISIVCCGYASFASAQARARVFPFGTHAAPIPLSSLHEMWSACQILNDRIFVWSEPT